MDTIGEVCYYLAFILPVFSTLLIWIRLRSLPTIEKVMLSVGIGFLLSMVMMGIAVSIFFKDGFGPS